MTQPKSNTTLFIVIILAMSSLALIASTIIVGLQPDVAMQAQMPMGGGYFRY